MASKVYGSREGNLWVRRIDTKKHVFKIHEAFGFHLHFRSMFANDPTLDGCQVVDNATGRTWQISREDWLANARYIAKPKPQYIVPIAAFHVVAVGKFGPIRTRRNKTQTKH
jgi:hypothetical protein